MEREKIVFYYPVTEQINHESRTASAKRHWYQEVSLEARVFDGQEDVTPGTGFPNGRTSGQEHVTAARKGETAGQECAAGRETARRAEFDVIGCPVPPFYYRHRPWKPDILSEAMENVLHRTEGMADAWLHPRIMEMLTEQYGKSWEPRRDTLRMIVKYLTEQYAAGVISRSGEAVVLLGKPADTDRQMEMTRELLQPFLPKINRLLIFYEEIDGTDTWMELENYLDEYYYEFGLVPQLEPYVRFYGGRRADFCKTQDPRSDCGICRQQDEMLQNTLKCGKPGCCGLILDYCEDFRYPKIMPDSTTVYLDVASAEGKERMLGRKTPRIPYISPLKHLDTIVKSSYYRKI